jgi:iron-sulfur cluster repair protein YtfE (RIC family)
LETTHAHCLSDLNHIHEQLDDLFFQHQNAILKCDCQGAKNFLAIFEKGLDQHMREENEILLPIYRERAVEIRGGDSVIFFGEHEKIKEWLARLKLRLSRIPPSNPQAKDVLDLLDDEAHFKKFVEHHALRENRILYPELERVITPKEKAGLIRLLTFSLSDSDNPTSDI